MKKKQWLNVPEGDMQYWLGQYLMAAMVLEAYKEGRGFPTKIGKFQCPGGKKWKGVVNYEARYARNG